MTNLLKLSELRKSVFVLLVLISTLIICVTIPKERLLKRNREIEHIKEGEEGKEKCIQYALIASRSGSFACYNCNDGKIYLEVGEVWKYGKTCNGEAGRYPDGFPEPGLAFQPQFYGSEQECLIEEKKKIYAYPTLPESRKRKVNLIRPPGNKIDR